MMFVNGSGRQGREELLSTPEVFNRELATGVVPECHHVRVVIEA